jgi:hypothetical protein
MKITVFTAVLSAGLVFGLLSLSAADRAGAAPHPSLRSICAKKARDSVGGDTYHQGKRYGALYRSCIASGGKI